ncbi:GNAT family N-acetyltransferase [uncultured Methanobrevibacter sp.]|uniref:GNAT family N-acetyltransferase n=1 Tax=uncultured Methanobrevibacter sp. TaxID=253161 RepID=UPI00260CEFDB|nr:N-acetyltransferase [uncultured Methanobrevibacter sp.]
MKIRLENKNDYREVENLVRNSFWNVYRPGAYEHYIVHNLRYDESFIKDLAYVIEEDGKIIGHINYSKGKLHFGDEKYCDAVVLGPVSIDNDYQGRGYGSKLIEYTLNLIDEFPFVFVVGDENYYSRFGFESASKYNIFLEGTDIDDECQFFMIKIFDGGKIGDAQAIFSNPDVFDVDESDVDEFDKQFEFKEKLVLEGQLVI